MLRELDFSFVTEKSTEKHCGEKLKNTYPKTETVLEEILQQYCPPEITADALKHKIETFLIREFYAPSHLFEESRLKPTRLWYEGAIIQLIDRPKIISIVIPAAKGVSYDVCIPMKQYLREAFGIQELHELYNNVVLEAQDLQEVSFKILNDIELWLDVVERDQQGTTKLENIKAITPKGVCGKIQ